MNRAKRFHFLAAASIFVAGTAAAADFPVGTFVCVSDQEAVKIPKIVKITAVTVGGVELPLFEAKADNGGATRAGSLRGIANFSENDVAMLLTLPISATNVTMAFNTTEVFGKKENTLLWGRAEYKCKPK